MAALEWQKLDKMPTFHEKMSENEMARLLNAIYRGTQEVLVRLSGKRLKRGRPPSAEILLSGLFVWLQMVDFPVSIDFDLTKVITKNSTPGKIMEMGYRLRAT